MSREFKTSERNIFYFFVFSILAVINFEVMSLSLADFCQFSLVVSIMSRRTLSGGLSGEAGPSRPTWKFLDLPFGLAKIFQQKFKFSTISYVLQKRKKFCPLSGSHRFGSLATHKTIPHAPIFRITSGRDFLAI